MCGSLSLLNYGCRMLVFDKKMDAEPRDIISYRRHCTETAMHGFAIVNVIIYILVVNSAKLLDVDVNLVSLQGLSLILYVTLTIKTAVFVMTRLNWKYSLLLFYFFFHPLIILTLVKTGSRFFPENYSSVHFLISNAGLVIQGAIVVMLWIGMSEEGWLKYYRFVWWVGVVIGIEVVIVYLLLYVGLNFDLFGLYDINRFVSIVVRSNVMSGVFGFLLSAFSLYFMRFHGFRKRYLFGYILGAIAVFACLERSIILGYAFFNAIIGCFYIIKGRNLLHKLNRFVLLCLSLPILLSVGAGMYFAAQSIKGHSLTSLASTYDRMARWVRAADMAVEYFPIGAGGNMDAKYIYQPRQESFFLTRVINSNILDSFGDESGELKIQFSKIYGYVSDPQVKVWSSTHSTMFELIVDFGILGFLFIWFMSWYPLKYLLKYKTLTRRFPCDKRVEAGACLASFLLCFGIPMSFLSMGQYLWFVVPFYVGFYKLHCQLPFK